MLWAGLPSPDPCSASPDPAHEQHYLNSLSTKQHHMTIMTCYELIDKQNASKFGKH